MSIYDASIQTLLGQPADLHEYEGDVLLVVNVASRCGLTPQYEGLEALEERYSKDGFHVLGFPCNQFKEQEPGTPEEIAEFCSATYGVTFPMFEKIDVNGPSRHPIYEELVQVPGQDGQAGDISWNFEKFLIARSGEILERFTPKTVPDDPAVIAAIEKAIGD